jgi:kynurenine formamidase
VSAPPSNETIAAANATRHRISRSPFGPDDQIGMLNMITPVSRAAALEQADATRLFDLSVEYHVGMPSWAGLGDPTYQFWMSHTPAGTVSEDAMGLGAEQNNLVAYSGDCVSMYTHTGTHLDALNHFGYCGEIWNGFTEEDHLGSRHWLRCGAEQQPPIMARGVLIDVARAHGTDLLPDSYAIGAAELTDVMAAQGTEVRPGDVVFIRTGRMTVWPDPERYLFREPGLNREGAELLARAGAMIIGSDSVALEQMPSADPENWHPVHTYLLAEAGVPIMENVFLEEISAASLHEFILIAAGLPLRGSTAAPMRPIAMPLHDR